MLRKGSLSTELSQLRYSNWPFPIVSTDIIHLGPLSASDFSFVTAIGRGAPFEPWSFSNLGLSWRTAFSFKAERSLDFACGSLPLKCWGRGGWPWPGVFISVLPFIRLRSSALGCVSFFKSLLVDTPASNVSVLPFGLVKENWEAFTPSSGCSSKYL